MSPPVTAHQTTVLNRGYCFLRDGTTFLGVFSHPLAAGAGEKKKDLLSKLPDNNVPLLGDVSTRLRLGIHLALVPGTAGGGAKAKQTSPWELGAVCDPLQPLAAQIPSMISPAQLSCYT